MQFAPSILSERLSDDPWSLSMSERRAVLTSAGAEHQRWLERLPALVEPPEPTTDFPAFLLSLPAFRSLRNAIGEAMQRADLDTATADQLQHFVDLWFSQFFFEGTDRNGS